MAPHPDVIVVGLGAMGSATTLELARRGVPVTGIDRFAPPHPYGSTHGETRITRLAIGEGAEYVPLVRRSHELWRALEAESGAELLRATGGLILAPAGSPFLRSTRAAADRYAIAHEILDAAELRRRFPMFAVDDGYEGYFEPTAGYLRPEAAVRVQLELAARHGATLRMNERVTAWSPSRTGVTVTTDRARYEAGRLVLAVGAWLPALFAQASAIFAVYRQLQYWFPIRTGTEQLARMPVFVWEFGPAVSGFVHLLGFYGFPAVDGAAGGVKLGTESYAATTVPDGQQHPASESEAREMFERYVAPHLPWLGFPPLRSISCLYTSARGSRFVIDAHPEHERVLVVSPCSGHGFKHSPAIGEAVAQQLAGQPRDIDLSPFALDAASTA